MVVDDYLNTVYEHMNFVKPLLTDILYIQGGKLTLSYLKELLKLFKKLINNSRGKYKRNECLINVCKSDTDLS